MVIRVTPPGAGLLMVILATLWLGACTATAGFREAAKLLDEDVAAVQYFVTNHGWHTGIVIPRRDLVERIPALAPTFPKGSYVEVGWGDAEFYRAGGNDPWLAVRALFWPTSSVLHVVGVPSAPQHYFVNSEVIALSVTAGGYGAMLDFITKSFRQLKIPTHPLEKGIYGESVFYPASGRYHLFNTCNTWTAKAIAQSGYPITLSRALTAGNLTSQLSGPSWPNPSGAERRSTNTQ